MQFHPTAFADRKNRECFLVSEAVRGEGAYLLNCHKERFMQKYEPEAARSLLHATWFPSA